jgi:hypothetical protein
MAAVWTLQAAFRIAVDIFLSAASAVGIPSLPVDELEGASSKSKPLAVEHSMEIPQGDPDPIVKFLASFLELTGKKMFISKLSDIKVFYCRQYAVVGESFVYRVD